MLSITRIVRADSLFFLLSEHEQAVENGTSIWQQHPEREQFIEQLLAQGYIVFTSELFGRHWGSQRACDYAERLYHFMMKNYILNKKNSFICRRHGSFTCSSAHEKEGRDCPFFFFY